MVGVVVATVVTVPIVLVAGVLVWWSASHAFAPNAARDAVEPVTAVLEDSGAEKTSTDSDPGLGPDNITPWFTVAYDVTDVATAQQLLERSAADLGRPLLPLEGDSTSTPAPCTEILHWAGTEGPDGNSTLTAEVTRATDAAGQCLEHGTITVSGTAPTPN